MAVIENTETFHNKTIVVAEKVGFRFEADLFKSVQTIQGFGAHNNIEMFHHKKRVAAETVGVAFEAHLFKSAPISFAFGFHSQH